MKVNNISRVIAAVAAAMLLITACGPGRGQNAGQSDTVADKAAEGPVSDSDACVYQDESFGISAYIENGKAVVEIDQDKLIAKGLMYEESSVLNPEVSLHEVEGLNVDCRKLFLGDIGQDYNPILCALTDEGKVHILSVFKAIQTGDFQFGGDIISARGAVSFKAMGGGAYDIDGETVYSYNTIGAVKADGSVTEIPVFLGQNCIQHETADGDVHMLLLSEDWSMSYIFFKEGNMSTEYSGCFHLLKSDDSSSVYSYEFTYTGSDDGTGTMSWGDTFVEGEFCISHDEEGIETWVTALKGLEFGSGLNVPVLFEIGYWGS